VWSGEFVIQAVVWHFPVQQFIQNREKVINVKVKKTPLIPDWSSAYQSIGCPLNKRL
jgi:hypothetical protein